MAETTPQSASECPEPGKLNLRVEPGETVVLSPDSPRFQAHYTQVRPRNIDEVRAAIGLTAEAAKAVGAQACCATSPAPSVLPPAEHLTDKDPETRFRAREAAYRAAQQYVQSPDPARLAHWKPVLNAFIEATKAILNLALLQDIEVANGATLVISQNTHAVYARNVRIHGNGKIVCQGSVTFRITSLEGVPLRITQPVPFVGLGQ
jgi:hypothetical protein